MKPADNPKKNTASQPSDNKTPTSGWWYALRYLLWFLPMAIVVVLWLVVVDSRYSGNWSQLWYLMIASAEFLPVLALIAGVFACIGLLLFARFVARKKNMYWSVLVTVPALAVLVWLFTSFL